MKTILLDGVEYVEKIKPTSDDYVIVRTCSAGVHAGFIKEKKGDFITLINARRIWYWDGAASLSQLAMEGVKKPENCKFPCEVNQIELKWIEIIPCTEQAYNIIKEVPVWSV